MPVVVVDRAAPPEGPEWARVRPAPASQAAVSHRMQDRLAEKRRVERRRRMSRGAKRVLAVGVVAGLGWLALLSPMFAVDADRVEVIGTGAVVDPAQVLAAVAPYEGQSLALMNTGHLSNQLEELQGVREAAVERVWPAGLRITITTRVPVAAIAAPAGGYVLLDDEAVEISRAEVPPAGVPIVGIPLTGNERILHAVMGVINEIPVELRERIGGISAQTEDSVVLQLRDGPRVEWGSAEQSALKAQVLLVMLESQQAGGAPVIDVSAPTLPITRTQ